MRVGDLVRRKKYQRDNGVCFLIAKITEDNEWFTPHGRYELRCVNEYEVISEERRPSKT